MDPLDPPEQIDINIRNSVIKRKNKKHKIITSKHIVQKVKDIKKKNKKQQEVIEK